MLSDWVFNENVLLDTPSRKDDVNFEQEKLYRFRTAWFIEELGREMLLSRTIVSMAIAYFQRFYLFQSFKQHNRFVRNSFTHLSQYIENNYNVHYSIGYVCYMCVFSIKSRREA